MCIIISNLSIFFFFSSCHFAFQFSTESQTSFPEIYKGRRAARTALLRLRGKRESELLRLWQCWGKNKLIIQWFQMCNNLMSARWFASKALEHMNYEQNKEDCCCLWCGERIFQILGWYCVREISLKIIISVIDDKWIIFDNFLYKNDVFFFKF